MNNLVGELSENKCDAILCRPGFFTAQGRQTSLTEKCQPCTGETELERKEKAPFYGSTKCKSVSEDRKILEQLHEAIFTGASEDQYWMTENPICSWQGIKCDDDTADTGVTEIKLESNSLQYSEKASELFFSLPDLEKLNIRGNPELTLTFEDVGKPPRLEMLQLSDTGLTSIEGINQATKLKELQ